MSEEDDRNRKVLSHARIKSLTLGEEKHMRSKARMRLLSRSVQPIHGGNSEKIGNPSGI